MCSSDLTNTKLQQFIYDGEAWQVSPNRKGTQVEWNEYLFPSALPPCGRRPATVRGTETKSKNANTHSGNHHALERSRDIARSTADRTLRSIGLGTSEIMISNRNVIGNTEREPICGYPYQCMCLQESVLSCHTYRVWSTDALTKHFSAHTARPAQQDWFAKCPRLYT